MKKVLKPIYSFTHNMLFNAMDYHPFFKKKINHQRIRLGFISEEHLKNPLLDDKLLVDLKQSGIETENYTIDVLAYEHYLKDVDYPISYYGGGLDPENNFTEKTLEHFVSLSFLNLNSKSRFVDVAAATSPFSEIVKKKFSLAEYYQQDLIFPKGLHANKIGGYAHEMPLAENSVDAISMHCSLEHFEGNSDTLFFKTIERILKPGGRCVVLPFYLASTYTIHIDPAFNFLKGHHPVIDPLAELRYCKWKQYHSRHYNPEALRRRILDVCPKLKLTVYKVNNFKAVASSCYLRFIGVFEKQH